MTQQTNSSSAGIGLPGALFLVFVVMNSTGYVDWSWWWVTSPLWIPIAGAAVVYGIIVLLVDVMGVRR